MPQTTAVQSRIAGLSDGPKQVISGVAVGSGDVTRGLSGDRKVWTDDELEAAAETLEGGDLKALHSETPVGTVTDAGYVPDEGVVYEAEIDDAELAEAIANGRLTVSVEARHADGGTVETDRGTAMRAAEIEFEDLAIVQRGAAPSASADPGEAAGLEAALAPADIHAALQSDQTGTLAEVPTEYEFDNPGEAVTAAQELGFEGAGDEIIHTHGEGEGTTFMPGPSHQDLLDRLEERDELAAETEFSEGDLVRWSTSESPGTGRVSQVVTDPGETVEATGADVTRQATADEAAYKLDNWNNSAEEYEAGTVVKSASEMLGPWDDAPETARMAAGVAAGTDDPETGEVPAAAAEATMDTDQDHDQDPDQTEYEALGSNLGEMLRGRMQELMTTSEMSRADLVDAAADAADRDRSTINAMARGEIQCPPMDVLEGLAEALGTDAATLRDAAERDGCEYSEAGYGSGGKDTDSDAEEEQMSDDDIQELKASLADKTDRIETLESELSELRAENDELQERADAVDEAEQAYAEALSEHVPRDAEALCEDLSLSQMREWLSDIDESDVSDAATEPTVRSGSNGEQTAASLAPDDRERKDEIESRLSTLEDKEGALAERERDRLEDELAEITGGNA